MTLIQAHVASVKSLFRVHRLLSRRNTPGFASGRHLCTHRIFRKNRTIESRSTRFRALLHPSNLKSFRINYYPPRFLPSFFLSPSLSIFFFSISMDRDNEFDQRRGRNFDLPRGVGFDRSFSLGINSSIL